MLNRILLVALCAIATQAAVEDCGYVAVASQADDGNTVYEYCSLDTDTTTGAANSKLTVDVAGTHNVCLELEPDSTLEQLYDNYGLETRPSFKGVFTENQDGGITFTLGQYNANCTLIQRKIVIDWGEEHCVNAQQESQGRIHDMYFLNGVTDCGGFGELSATAQRSAALNDFTNQQDSLFDVWQILTAVANSSSAQFSVNDKVLSQSLTVDPDTFTRDNSYCYGVGNKFAPPLFFPSLYEREVDGENVTFARNLIQAPADGYACGYDCTDDMDAAYATYAAVVGTHGPQVALVAAINSLNVSECGARYLLGAGFDDEENAETGGYDPTKFLVATLMLDVGQERQCGVCTPAFQNLINFQGHLGVFLPDAPSTYTAGSRYTFCQPDVVMSSRFYVVEDSDVNDFSSFSECTSTGGGSSGASALAALFALVASVFVALRA